MSIRTKPEAAVGIVIDLTARRPARPMIEAAGSVDPVANPLLAGVAAGWPPAVAREVRRIIAEGVVAGATTAELARRLAALGLNRRAAEGLARTGAAILAADARQRAF